MTNVTVLSMVEILLISLKKSSRPQAEIQISDERDLLMDTGGGIVKATPLFRDSQAVLVHNVDIISDVNLKDLGQSFLASDDNAWLLTQDRETNRKLLFNAENQLVPEPVEGREGPT